MMRVPTYCAVIAAMLLFLSFSSSAESKGMVLQRVPLQTFETEAVLRPDGLVQCFPKALVSFVRALIQSTPTIAEERHRTVLAQTFLHAAHTLFVTPADDMCDRVAEGHCRSLIFLRLTRDYQCKDTRPRIQMACEEILSTNINFSGFYHNLTSPGLRCINDALLRVKEHTIVPYSEDGNR